MAVAYTSSTDFYADIASFMAAGGIIEEDDFDSAELPTGLEHIVTNTSSDGVFQGSISRS